MVHIRHLPWSFVSGLLPFESILIGGSHFLPLGTIGVTELLPVVGHHFCSVCGPDLRDVWVRMSSSRLPRHDDCISCLTFLLPIRSRITLCSFSEKKIKALLNRFGAPGAFLNFVWNFFTIFCFVEPVDRMSLTFCELSVAPTQEFFEWCLQCKTGVQKNIPDCSSLTKA